jgi:catechol 2,3-dioxygenase-like lactoylglutathione lyase family enzyme
MTLDHTIVPARDKDASARFLAELLGLAVGKPVGPFATVRLGDGLTLDFAERLSFEPHHYAFRVTDDEFDAVFGRIERAGIVFSGDPHFSDVGRINHRNGGRGVYFRDGNGHVLELLTRP